MTFTAESTCDADGQKLRGYICTYMIGYLAQPVSETEQQARRMLNLTQNIHSYILFLCHLPNPKEPRQSPVSLPCPPSLQNAYTKPNKALLYKSRSWLQSHLLMAAKITVFWNLLVLEDILQAVWKPASGHIRTTRASSSNVQVQEQKLQFDTYDPPFTVSYWRADPGLDPLKPQNIMKSQLRVRACKRTPQTDFYILKVDSC